MQKGRPLVAPYFSFAKERCVLILQTNDEQPCKNGGNNRADIDTAT